MFNKLLKAYRYGKTITGMKPKIAKTTGEKIKREFRDMGRTVKAQSKKTTDDVSLKVNEIRKKLDKMREPKMGGGMMGRPMYKKGGKSFPDLTGDGKVTKADILKGRGVPGFRDGSKGPVQNIKRLFKGNESKGSKDAAKKIGKMLKEKNNAKN